MLAQRVIALLYSVGAFALLFAVFIGNIVKTAQIIYPAMAALLLAGALVTHRSKRGGVWMTRSGVLLGVLAIGTTIMVAALGGDPRPLSSLSLLYLWPLLYAGYFLGRRGVALTTALTAATIAAVIFASNVHVDPTLLVTLLSLPLAALVVLMLRERVHGLSEQLENETLIDSLTGLMTHHAFDTILARQIPYAVRHRVETALVRFDIDQLRQLNEQLGRAAGDDLLRRFAAILTGEARGSDSVARLGGGEFAILLVACDEPGAAAFAERVRTTLRAASISLGRAQTVSAGVAAVPFGDATFTSKTLLWHAHSALHDAKRSGRDRVARERTISAVDASVVEAAVVDTSVV